MADWMDCWLEARPPARHHHRPVRPITTARTSCEKHELRMRFAPSDLNNLVGRSANSPPPRGKAAGSCPFRLSDCIRRPKAGSHHDMAVPRVRCGPPREAVVSTTGHHVGTFCGEIPP